jgi:hypothetical protein
MKIALLVWAKEVPLSLGTLACTTRVDTHQGVAAIDPPRVVGGFTKAERGVRRQMIELLGICREQQEHRVGTVAARAVDIRRESRAVAHDDVHVAFEHEALIRLDPMRVSMTRRKSRRERDVDRPRNRVVMRSHERVALVRR